MPGPEAIQPINEAENDPEYLETFIKQLENWEIGHGEWLDCDFSKLPKNFIKIFENNGFSVVGILVASQLLLIRRVS